MGRCSDLVTRKSAPQVVGDSDVDDSEVPVVVFGVLGLVDDVGRSRTGEEVMVRSPSEVKHVIVEFSRLPGGVRQG